MSEPQDFSYEQFLNTDLLAEDFGWNFDNATAASATPLLDFEPQATAQPANTVAGARFVQIATGCGDVPAYPSFPALYGQQGHHAEPQVKPMVGNVSLPFKAEDSQHGPPGRHMSTKRVQCSYSGCHQTFKNSETRNRHVIYQHYRSKYFLCPLEACARGVPGEGFRRRYVLINHLISANNNVFSGQGHGMTKGDAERAVAEAMDQAAEVRHEARKAQLHADDIDAIERCVSSPAEKAELIAGVKAGGELKCDWNRDCWRLENLRVVYHRCPLTMICAQRPPH